MVRSAMLVPTATIGAVRLMAPSPTASTFAAAMPACSTTAERTDSLCVALRIRHFDIFDNLTLYPAIPLGWQDFITAKRAIF